MSTRMRIGAVILAAGASSRFGSNKLLADFGGRPVICRALEAVCTILPERAVVVTGNADIAALADAYGFEVVENCAPEEGMSRSIRLGVSALGDMDAVLLLVGDQPKLKGSSLRKLCTAFAAEGKGMACLCDETHSGNPAVFSAKYYAQLLTLSGDCGAKAILRTHAQDLVFVDCEEADELCDCDEPELLERLKAEI